MSNLEGPDLETVHYRQAERDPGTVLLAAAGILLVYVFAGFIVYWLRTGSGTVGTGGRLTDLGGLIWFGPLVVWLVLIFVGPRGPFMRLWKPPIVLDVDQQGLAWDIGGRRGRADWADIGGFADRPYAGPRSSLSCVISDRQGRKVALVPSRVIGPDRKRRWTVDVMVETRPDLFERARRSVWRTAFRRSGTG